MPQGILRVRQRQAKQILDQGLLNNGAAVIFVALDNGLYPYQGGAESDKENASNKEIYDRCTAELQETCGYGNESGVEDQMIGRSVPVQSHLEPILVYRDFVKLDKFAGRKRLWQWFFRRCL